MARTSNTTPETEPFPGHLPEIAFSHHLKILHAPMREWRARKQPSPVLLLTGQPGIGKRALSYALSQWIFCETSGLKAVADSFQACGSCSSCTRIVGGGEARIREIRAEVEDGALKIDQFRDLKTKAGYGALDSEHQIVLIPHADRMTPQAANSILKILEEPPVGWIFILTAQDSSLLLPTIISRCQVLRLSPFQPHEIEALLALEGVNEARRKICAHLAQGSWSRARSLAEDQTWDQRRTLFQFIQEPGSTLASLVDWATQGPAQFELMLDLLEQITAELVLWSAQQMTQTAPSPYPWIQFDGAAEYAAHIRRVTQKGISHAHSFWIRQAERLAQARQEATTPVNRKLLVQDLLLPWLGEA